MKNSTLLHLRIPFSFFLMPAFLLAVCVVPNLDLMRSILVFIVWHLFVYPASNGFNSFYDKDKGSIGGLEKPPPVSSELLFFSLLFDIVALAMSFFVSFEFVMAVLIYGLVSKAYSHPAIRLKKYPILGLFSVSIFQGTWVFLSSYQAISQIAIRQLFDNEQVILLAVLSFLLFFASYPITQIYQHEEDAQRNDLTMSRLLGIKGTFIWTATCFGILAMGFVWFFIRFYALYHAVTFLFFLMPVLFHFFNWFYKSFLNTQNANFKQTMRLNFLSGIALNLFFIWWLLEKYELL